MTTEGKEARTKNQSPGARVAVQPVVKLRRLVITWKQGSCTKESFWLPKLIWEKVDLPEGDKALVVTIGVCGFGLAAAFVWLAA